MEAMMTMETVLGVGLVGVPTFQIRPFGHPWRGGRVPAHDVLVPTRPNSGPGPWGIGGTWWGAGAEFAPEDFPHFGRAGEGNEDEEALERVEEDKDDPKDRNVHKASHNSHDPTDSHQEAES